jgi:hypothetical protein
MKKLLIIAVIFLFGAITLHAQGELDQQPKVFFRNEQSFGILLNSDGIGISYREAKRIDYRNKWLLEFDGGTLKNQKEFKQSSPLAQGGSYIFGKLNSTFYLRAGFGRQHELFKKTDLGGIAVRYFYSAGPVLAILKPIYYRVYYLIPGTGNEYEEKDEKFDNSMAAAQDIYGKASFIKGFNEISILPGLYAKAGFNFEYSKEDKIIHAVEFGGQLNAFPKKVPIMAASNNKALFFSLFISYRFGMILDPLDPESNKLSNIFRRKRND